MGVDGGGTKTQFVWMNERGEIVARELRGSSNPNDIGKDQLITDMVAAVSKHMPSDAESISICMGLSGMSFSNCKDELICALSKIDRVGAVDVCSDVQIALDAAYDGDGCIVIMGTGSVGYLRKKGELMLIGGCGYMIDSSLSGYDLGREVLNAVCSEHDGRAGKTLLSETVLSATGMSVAELVKFTYIKGKAYVASFAPHVFAAYRRGDKIAEEILVRRVREWESLLWGVYNAYGEDECEITLIGGLTNEWDVLSKFLSAKIKEKISFRLLREPAVYGALKRARSIG